MDLKQLRYFVAVARELHFGRAAARLRISQPALSFDIKKFEAQLGVQLLTRSHRRVALTGAGQTLLAEADSLLRQAADAEHRVRRSAQGLTGRLRVGFVNSMLFRRLPEAVTRFCNDHPGIDIVLSELNTSEQISALARHHIDIGCAHSTRHPKEITSQTLLTEPFVCCLPAGHAHASVETIALETLADEPFILFPRTVSPHYHDRIVALCVEAGFSPEIRHEVRLWQTVIAMVERDMGIALVPSSLAHTDNPRLRFTPLAGNAGVSEIKLLLRAEDNEPMVDAFLECLHLIMNTPPPKAGGVFIQDLS